jgi:hypothetical protein
LRCGKYIYQRLTEMHFDFLFLEILEF